MWIRKLFGRIRIHNDCSDPDLGPTNEHPLTKNFNFLLKYKEHFFGLKLSYISSDRSVSETVFKKLDPEEE